MNEYPYLNTVHSPEDVKALPQGELLSLCAEIRRFLVDKVSKRGGHLASNLGVVELTVALHRVFDSPRDRILFDVGHQSYVHKMLTGRTADFDSLRAPGGLSGFPVRRESVHDPFGTGHSSTSLSAALGFARADALRGETRFTVAVVGDGAFTGGMIHEALNNCEGRLHLLIVLNDNEMSISKNIGAFARYFSRIRSTERYQTTKRKTRNLLSKIPLVGKAVTRFIRALKNGIKRQVYRNNYFEALGLAYLGPVDGHDERALERVFREAKSRGGVSVVHVHTKKGMGYARAEEDPTAFHGLSPNGENRQLSFREVAVRTLTLMAKDDEDICAVTAAMGEGTALSRFGETFPDRYFDVGIAEEHALTFSAGLAAAGLKPYFAVYSTFLQRAYDNLVHDVALQGLPVRILVDRAGLAEGDGATHHGIFDVAFASHVPGVSILSPATYGSLAAMLASSGAAKGPLLIRYPKSAEDARVPALFYPKGDYENYGVRALGTREPRAVLLAYGNAVTAALDALLLLGKAGVHAEMILIEALAPYDALAAQVIPMLPEDVPVFFVEEGVRDGGAGMLLGERLHRVFDARGKMLSYHVLGIDGHFAAPRELVSLRAYCGIDGDTVAAFVTETLGMLT
ncbi:MAG: 1-deoxy-D-xylulose-5-phosphate synthase [Ruminococcaceae bacterium]|nr:1-deoxy-D-xylulose-5-phosphate synthase [Oscillospiraceae bacterium]